MTKIPHIFSSRNLQLLLWRINRRGMNYGTYQNRGQVYCLNLVRSYSDYRSYSRRNLNVLRETIRLSGWPTQDSIWIGQQKGEDT